MEVDIITKEDDRIKKVFKQIEQIKGQIKAIERCDHPLFNGDRFITDADLSAKLIISRRTLQEWRTNGLLGFIRMGGKVIYRESDIEKLLKDNYEDAFQNRVLV